jgi:hypothetical protein
MHAKRVDAIASDVACESIGQPRTAGFELDKEYYQTDEWCEEREPYTGEFAPIGNGRRRPPGDGRGGGGSGGGGSSGGEGGGGDSADGSLLSRDYQCYKRGSGEIELSYDQVGAEIPSGINVLSFRHKYGVTPIYHGIKQAAYDIAGYTIFFDDLLLSTPYVEGDGDDVMIDPTLGGSSYDISYTLKDHSGNTIQTCANANKHIFDWRDTCGAGPFAYACEFDTNHALVVPMKSLMEAAEIVSLDQRIVDIDPEGLAGCTSERLHRMGLTAESWDAAVDAGILPPDWADSTYEEFESAQKTSCEELTFRDSSWTLYVVFHCENLQGARGKLQGPWTGNKIECEIHTRAAYREMLADETYGVEIHVIHSGDVCEFNFASLLTALTSALGLLAVSHVITMALLKFVHPHREVLKA